jgi:phosphate-selective porin OprO/OprP
MFQTGLFSLLSILTTGGSTPALASDVSLMREEPAQELVGYDHGFFMRSADGSSEFLIEGLLQVDFFKNDPRRVPETDFELNRIRPEFAGRFDDIYRFRIEPIFSAHEVELEEAWLGFECPTNDQLWMFGRMKAPFGLEEVRSRRHIPFARFSILNQYSPAEQHGVFANGRKRNLEYGLGLYNGGGDDDGDDGKELAMRAMIHPYSGTGRRSLENLQLGVALTYGEEDRSLSGGSIESATGKPLILYSPAASLAGDQVRLGLEAAWFEGPHMAQAEWIWTRQSMDGAVGPVDVDTTGVYVALQRVLTGEDISFGGVRPAHPVRGHLGDACGAWVAAARLSYLDTDSALANEGVVLPSTYTSNITSLWLGLNWYLSDHFLVRNSYVHSLYAGHVQVGDHSLSSEGAFIVELQLHF